MRIIYFFLLIAIITCCSSENTQIKEIEKKDTVLSAPTNHKKITPDKMPVPIGGIEGIKSRLVYPYTAKHIRKGGKVIIKTYIDDYGDVQKTEIVQGIGYGCDEAAEKAIKGTKFIPGKHNGKYVKCIISIPILFQPVAYIY